MKTLPNLLLLLLLLLALLPGAQAQLGLNSPAGVRPVMDLEVYSRNTFSVQQKYRVTTANPLSNTSLISCTTGSNPPIYAEAGVIMDPSGYTGYANNVEYRCSKRIYGAYGASGPVVGIELIIEQIDLGPPGLDEVTISSENFTSANMPRFSGTNNPGRIVIPDTEFTISFYGHNDGLGGRGFRIQWRALYADTAPAVFPLWTATNQLRFEMQTGSLFAGSPSGFRGWRFGDYSVSLGQQNMARGDVSAAIGRENITGSGIDGIGGGLAAIAMGYSNFASGDYSAAIGNDNYTVGNNTIALGYRNRPSGNYGVAVGNSNAAGLNAIALGFTNGVGGDYALGIGRNNTVGAPGGVAIGAYNFVPTSTTNSVAIGQYNQSTGFASMALGTSLVVSGGNAVAFGLQNTASGSTATAMGNANTASGATATVMGSSNTASGIASTALGYLNVASGNFSTALGHRMNTNGQAGAFMIGDTDPLGQGTTSAGAADQFVARFRNGYYLMTSGTVTRTGVVIGAGQNAWGIISDSTKKERLLPMNHAEVLRKINAMKLTSWNYKGQREIRHYGPMAQDFYAAFGHDGLGPIGCDTLINSHDFAGVTFAGVQALIRENEQLKAETKRLRAETQNFASLQAEMNIRLKLLEQAALGRKRVAIRKR